MSLCAVAMSESISTPHDASRVYDAIAVLDQRTCEYQQKGLSTAAVEQLRDHITTN